MHTHRLYLSLILALAYNIFFWQEKLGINLLLFSALLIGINIYLNPKALKSSNTLLVMAGTLLSGVMVVIHNSGASKVVHVLSMVLFVGLVHQPSFRSMAHAFLQSLQAFIQSFQTFWESITMSWVKSVKLKKIGRILSLTLIPLAVMGVFYLIYYFANPKFAEMSGQLGEYVAEWFSGFSILRALFFLSGFFIAIYALIPFSQSRLPQLDASSQNQLQRRRFRHNHAFSMLELKKEYLVGVLLVGMVNVLLLVNNVLDIRWLWFDFELPAGLSYKQLVHEGTYLLIFSILLSMGIMLYFYRANQNFYKQGDVLRYLTYTWIIQNLILVISVGIRNYHYMANQGLAYKRIGVVFFLALVIFGLFTLFFKIRDKMSTFYLLRVNSWAVYVIGIALCVVNWDIFIAKYNFEHYEETGHLTLELSPKTLPLFLSHEEILMDYYGNNIHYQVQVLRGKERRYLESWKYKSWLSWNYADAKARKMLEDL